MANRMRNELEDGLNLLALQILKGRVDWLCRMRIEGDESGPHYVGLTTIEDQTSHSAYSAHMTLLFNI